MKARNYLILFIIIMFGIFLISSVSALTVSKTELKTFLKTELNNYFDGKQTVLSASEIRELLDVYTGSGSSITFDESSVSANLMQILSGKYNTRTAASMTSNVGSLKVKGEKCKRMNECASGKCKCVKHLFAYLGIICQRHECE